VIPDPEAGGRSHDATSPVDCDNRIAEAKIDTVILVPPEWRQQQIVLASSSEEIGEVDAIVRRPCLFAEDDDAVTVACADVDELPAQAMAGHAIPDDNQWSERSGRQ
jgi:hypothetical protein